MKTIVVIPTIRDLSFLDEWEAEFRKDTVSLIVCEDHDTRKIKVPNWDNITVYSHKEINKELGENSWIISTKDAAIRSFGYWKAWQQKPDMIFTIDDDCYPEQGMSSVFFLSQPQRALLKKVTLDWVMTDPYMYTRGFPYGIREQNEVVVNHGLWSNIPDLDAPTALQNPDLRFQPSLSSQVIPRNNFFPMCGMNLAFKTKITPLMYFGLQGEKWGFSRFDDIWCGIFAKKIIDHLGYAVTSGKPSVEHRKKSNVFANLKKEASGIEVNEVLWKKVKEIQLTKSDPIDCYRELLANLELSDKYWVKFKEATNLWLDLFK